METGQVSRPVKAGAGRRARRSTGLGSPFMPQSMPLNPTLLGTRFLLPQVLAPEGSLGPPAERRCLPSLAPCSAASQEAHMAK